MLNRTLLLITTTTLLSAADSDSVLARVAAHADRFGAVSRQIWETPELGFHETKSSALLQTELPPTVSRSTPTSPACPPAFTATFGSGKPVIVLMGEFDALPGLSQKDVPAQSPVQRRRARPRLRPQSAGLRLRSRRRRD